MAVPIGDSPTRGPADAWVTLVEFSDFECAYCGAAQPTIAQLLALYPTDLRLVFKHFPLSFHADARPAALAAECARVQGRFWQMHDVLWAGQPLLSSSDLAADASGAGLELGAWQSCLSSSEAAARVDADIALGEQMGVRATPTFALNGQPLEGAAPLDVFKQKVESARATAEASGIVRQEYYDRAVLGLHE
jgi:protein-disulfide isomerase